MTTNVVTVVDEDSAMNKNFLSNIEINNIIQAYNYSQKVLAAAILWLCGKLSDKQFDVILKGTVTTNEELLQSYETVNSITNYLGGKLFIPNNVEPKEFKVDPKELCSVIRDLNRIDALIGTNFPDIYNKADKYYMKETGFLISAIAGAKMPVFTSSNILPEENKANKQIVNRIEGFIGDIIAPYKHYIVPSNYPGFFTIAFPVANGMMRTVEIDPGNQFGEYKVVIPDVNNTFYLTSNKELIKHFIETAMPLSREEVTNLKLQEHYFMDNRLYCSIAVKDAQSIINRMSREQISVLENKLKFVLEILKSGSNGQIPLLRIRNIKNENSFILVSDNKCVGPFLDVTNHKINPLPLEAKVSKESFTIVVKDVNGLVVTKDKFEFDMDIVNEVYNPKFNFDNAVAVNDIVRDLKKIESHE